MLISLLHFRDGGDIYGSYYTPPSPNSYTDFANDCAPLSLLR
jgi:hypothetical protein